MLTVNQIKILCELDTVLYKAWLMEYGAIPELVRDTSDFSLLVSMHKIRYESPQLPEDKRHESAAFLRLHNMQAFCPLLPPGELPS